jgi:PTS system nitrogen regulatory IIA component
MKISDILNVADVITLDDISSKRELLQNLTTQAAKTANVDGRTLFDVVLERENLGTTAFGKGTALPHGRIPELNKIQTVFAKVNGGADFDAADGQKVDLVFMLLSPENSGADHLMALAEMSKLIKNESTCSKLRKATSSSEIYKILTE